MAEKKLEKWGRWIVHDSDNFNPNELYIAGVEVNLKHRALEIYISGCEHHNCKGCHNPELWVADVGLKLGSAIDDILKKALVGKAEGLLEYIWILGGEPMDHSYELKFLLECLNDVGLKIVLWTHYTYAQDDIPFPGLIDYIKMGPYVAGGESYTDPVLGVELANKEQYVLPVPGKKSVFYHLPFCLMPVDIDPVLFLYYYDHPNQLLHHHKAQLYRTAIDLFDYWGGFSFVRSRLLFTIEHHPDIPVLDIYPKSMKELYDMQYDVVPKDNWEDFLAGRWPVYLFSGEFFEACTRS